MQHYLSHSFPLPIWRMLADPAGKGLALHLRDEAAHSVKYAWLSTNPPAVRWEDLEPEDGWWTDLAAVTSSRLILKHYPETNDPFTYNLLGYNVAHKSPEWRLQGYQIIEGQATGAVVQEQNLQPGTSLHYLDYDRGRLHPLAHATATPPAPEPLKTPVHYADTEAHFQTVAAFLKSLGLAPVKAAEYLEIKDYILISFYLWENNKLANHLLVTHSTTGKVLLQEKLTGGADGVGYGTFFVTGTFLYFIKERSILEVYAI